MSNESKREKYGVTYINGNGTRLWAQSRDMGWGRTPAFPFGVKAHAIDKADGINECVGNLTYAATVETEGTQTLINQ